MSPLQFYEEQAAKQSAASDQANLQNVRDRCQRAAAAWSVLAAREKRTDDARERRRAASEASAEPNVGSPNHSIGLD